MMRRIVTLGLTSCLIVGACGDGETVQPGVAPGAVSTIDDVVFDEPRTSDTSADVARESALSGTTVTLSDTTVIESGALPVPETEPSEPHPEALECAAYSIDAERVTRLRVVEEPDIIDATPVHPTVEDPNPPGADSHRFARWQAIDVQTVAVSDGLPEKWASDDGFVFIQYSGDEQRALVASMLDRDLLLISSDSLIDREPVSLLRAVAAVDGDDVVFLYPCATRLNFDFMAAADAANRTADEALLTDLFLPSDTREALLVEIDLAFQALTSPRDPVEVWEETPADQRELVLPGTIPVEIIDRFEPLVVVLNPGNKPQGPVVISSAEGVVYRGAADITGAMVVLRPIGADLIVTVGDGQSTIVVRADDVVTDGISITTGGTSARINTLSASDVAAAFRVAEADVQDVVTDNFYDFFVPRPGSSD